MLPFRQSLMGKLNPRELEIIYSLPSFINMWMVWSHSTLYYGKTIFQTKDILWWKISSTFYTQYWAFKQKTNGIFHACKCIVLLITFSTTIDVKMFHFGKHFYKSNIPQYICNLPNFLWLVNKIYEKLRNLSCKMIYLNDYP